MEARGRMTGEEEPEGFDIAREKEQRGSSRPPAWWYQIQYDSRPGPESIEGRSSNWVSHGDGDPIGPKEVSRLEEDIASALSTVKDQVSVQRCGPNDDILIAYGRSSLPLERPKSLASLAELRDQFEKLAGDLTFRYAKLHAGEPPTEDLTGNDPDPSNGGVSQWLNES